MVRIIAHPGHAELIQLAQENGVGVVLVADIAPAPVHVIECAAGMPASALAQLALSSIEPVYPCAPATPRSERPWLKRKKGRR